MEKELVSNRKLKFLFISSDKYPPFRVDITILFGKEMVERGHSIDWILQSQDQCHTSFRTTWSGCRVWVGATDTGTSRFNRLRKYALDILHSFKMFNLIRKNEYDFIQVKDMFIVALVAIIAAKLYRKKLVYWLSYPFPEASLYAVKEGTARYPWFYYFRGIFLKLILYHIITPVADHVFVQSEVMKKDVAAMGIGEKKLTSVPMGIYPEMFPVEQGESKEKLGTSEPCVLYLGTLAKVRRIDFLIRVFSQVVREIPQAKLYLVGKGDDPSDEQLLKDEAKKLGISNSIVFTGFLPRRAAFDIVKQANVCISPYYSTPILNSTSPTKLIEYMAIGKAVVANDHPEQRLIIEESGSGICVPYQEKAFADAIVELLHHPDRAEEMGKRGRSYVFKHRSYGKIADIVENQYLRICEED